MASENVVTKKITIRANPAQVWRALTDTDLIRQWLSAEGTLQVHTDWTVGGPIVQSGPFQGYHYESKGVVLAFEVEKLLRYSQWVKISRLPDKPENYAVVEFRLTPLGSETELTLIHSNLIALAAMQHSNFYWNTTLGKIKQLVEQGTSASQSSALS